MAGSERDILNSKSTRYSPNSQKKTRLLLHIPKVKQEVTKKGFFYMISEKVQLTL